MSDRISIADHLYKWESSSEEPVNIIVAGKHKSGKTTLVNALCDNPLDEDNLQFKFSNNKHNIPSHGITVWDACSVFQSHPDSDRAVRTMKKIDCLKNPSEVVLLYTIPINQTRFLMTSDNNWDICAMKRLTTEFGERIWEHAIIVFTFTNEHFLTKKVNLGGETDEQNKKLYYDQEFPRWTVRVRNCLKTHVVSEEIAQNIPIVPAGYLRHLQAPQSLECDSDGESWILRVWHKIAESAPKKGKFVLLSYCLDRCFHSPYFYADSYLSFVKIHGLLYQEVASERDDIQDCTQLCLAYSYLRILKKWFDNYAFLLVRKWRYSQDISSTASFWKNYKTDVNVLVSGACQSGKTSLINSMLYNKKNLEEIENHHVSCNSVYKNITCTFEEHSLTTLTRDKLDTAAVLLICITIDDTKENITKTVTSIADLSPTNIVVVLTFAGSNLLSLSLNESIHERAALIKEILRSHNFDGTIVDSLCVVAAGYHSNTIIQDDHMKKNWIMNIWLNAVANARISCQSSMVVYVNHFIYGGLKRKTVSQHHLELYREQLLHILCEMMEEHKI